MIKSTHESALKYAVESACEVRRPADLESLIERVGGARVVMLGGASHGAHEFYEWRRLISEWLIVKKGFDFIAVEGDWPDGARIDSYILGAEPADPSTPREAKTARAVLAESRRWPSWMWSNEEVAHLMEWMKTQGRARFYGLDLYSLFESIDAVVGYLDTVNPLLARRARVRYACFDRFERDEIAYARSTLSLPDGCEEAVIRNLRDLLDQRLGLGFRDPWFSTAENAHVVRDAEKYYRTMVRADETSWNVRDRHMMNTLERLLAKHGSESKGIVWAHNSHIGDYRATPMASQGLVNLGGLARQRLGEGRVALVGFGTYSGEVTASHSWGGPTLSLKVPPARSDSYEHLFHQAAGERDCGVLGWILDAAGMANPLAEVRGHRAIGVVYDPAHERFSNYVPTALARRYDAFLFVDQTTALAPIGTETERQSIPGTYPVGQ